MEMVAELEKEDDSSFSQLFSTIPKLHDTHENCTKMTTKKIRIFRVILCVSC
jgi:hypothetical protein